MRDCGLWHRLLTLHEGKDDPWERAFLIRCASGPSIRITKGRNDRKALGLQPVDQAKLMVDLLFRLFVIATQNVGPEVGFESRVEVRIALMGQSLELPDLPKLELAADLFSGGPEFGLRGKGDHTEAVSYPAWTTSRSQFLNRIPLSRYGPPRISGKRLPADKGLLGKGKLENDRTMIGGKALIVHFSEWRIHERKAPSHKIINFDAGRGRWEGLGIIFLGKDEKT